MIRTVATAATVMILVAGCGGATHDDASLATAASVRVEAEGCSPRPISGAGAFVGTHRVLTVAHVVAGSTDVDVILADGTEKAATVVAIDRHKDLAVLDVDSTTSPLRIGTMQAGAHGAFVSWRSGHGMAQPFAASSLIDITASDIDAAGVGPRRGYELSADVQPGDSGAVLVAGGAAVAVVFARSTTRAHQAWATDIAEAAPLLASAGTGPVDVGGCPTEH